MKKGYLIIGGVVTFVGILLLTKKGKSGPILKKWDVNITIPEGKRVPFEIKCDYLNDNKVEHLINYKGSLTNNGKGKFIRHGFFTKGDSKSIVFGGQRQYSIVNTDTSDGIIVTLYIHTSKMYEFIVRSDSHEVTHP